MKLLISCVLILLTFGSCALPAQADSFLDTFDADMLRWQEVINAQQHQLELPCQNQDAFRTDWSSVGQKAFLALDRSPACFAAVRIQDRYLPEFSRTSIRFQMRYEEDLAERVWFVQAQDAENWLALFWSKGQVTPHKRIDGANYWSGPTREVPLKEGEEHFIHIEYWKNRRLIRLFVNHEFVTEFYESDTHPQLSGGTPGFGVRHDRPNLSSKTWIDHFQVEELDSKRMLDVFSLSQRDLRWNTLPYDHAHTWSRDAPTIENWGCALVSAAMVLRSHGLRMISPAQELTPATLNTWLIQQPDGYLGQGNLNWRAITRLVWQISALNSAPKLEFARFQPEQSEKISWLTEKLQLGLPVILEQPGHFIVVYGFDEEDSTIFIHDPYHEHRTLAEYGNNFISARLFVPSFTDLSSILVVSPVNSQLIFRNELGQELSPSSWIENPLLSTESKTAAGRPVKIWEFAQPPDMNFTITTDTPPGTAATVEVFTYQKDGTAAQHTWLLGDETAETTIAVMYQKQATTEFFAPEYKIVLGARQLDALISSGELRSPLLANWILKGQTRLQSTQDLVTALAQFRLIRMLLFKAQQTSWVEPWVTEHVLRVFQDIIRNRSP